MRGMVEELKQLLKKGQEQEADTHDEDAQGIAVAYSSLVAHFSQSPASAALAALREEAASARQELVLPCCV